MSGIVNWAFPTGFHQKVSYYQRYNASWLLSRQQVWFSTRFCQPPQALFLLEVVPWSAADHNSAAVCDGWWPPNEVFSSSMALRQASNVFSASCSLITNRINIGIVIDINDFFAVPEPCHAPPVTQLISSLELTAIPPTFLWDGVAVVQTLWRNTIHINSRTFCSGW